MLNDLLNFKIINIVRQINHINYLLGPDILTLLYSIKTNHKKLEVVAYAALQQIFLTNPHPLYPSFPVAI